MNFESIGELVAEARNLLDTIKGGAIRAMQTKFDALMITFQGQVNSFVGNAQSRLATMESSLSAAVKSQMTMTVHVDCLSGSDANAGTSSAPLKTIGKAVRLIPNGGVLNIVMHSDITNLFGSAIGSAGRHALSIGGGKTVKVDLNGHALVVRTSHWNSWADNQENPDNPSLNIGFGCSLFSSLAFENGRIDIQYQSGDEGKSLYFHAVVSSLFCGDVSKYSLSNVEIYSNVDDAGLFGLDGWSASTLFAHLRGVSFLGQGQLKRSVNSADKADIKVTKLSTDYGSWT
ncbi:hypothetical protein [Vibrio mediterranei]|uniref:hypothetical protein n=1 Tax=Vibrio mediterranei TaxID=689 RepID=UPI00148D9CAB|nr:hypothetical protein [Vibrio mediterranei]NOH31600.1 hypothetical protein [Vibrio mediterranei]